jgi:hypothetical protein
MPTRYTLDVDFKTSVASDVLDNATKKVEVQKVRDVYLLKRACLRPCKDLEHPQPLTCMVACLGSPVLLRIFSFTFSSHALIMPPCPSLFQECKKMLEEKFKTGKNRWFFSKLRF